MCELHSTATIIHKGKKIRVDSCIKELVAECLKDGIPLVASCCGHGIYPVTLICKEKNQVYDLESGIDIPRKTRFYKKDKHGNYYVPEVSAPFESLSP